MSILYQGVFGILVTEKYISKSPLVDHVKYVVRILFVIVVILFAGRAVWVDDADSVQRSFKTQERHDQVSEQPHHIDSRADSYLHAKLFQAQRNMYLTGSVIFLSLVLNRFYNMIVELSKNEEKMEVLKQQAAKTTKEYLKLLDKDQKQSSSSSNVEKDYEEKKKECAKLTQDLEVVKRQADQTHAAYLKLTDEYAALEKKLGLGGGSKKDD
ncbi:hypothetical protein HDV03_002770 [Kappamyces sp. JEL0829]|nr:hypothetical protein HDV03_002770 [Kappamyces sp. JEL0829]